jgi:hypothetical protein
MINELGRIWKETLVAYTAYYSSIFLEGLRTETDLNGYSPYSVQDKTQKQFFEYIYRVVKSGELEGYQLTSSSQNSSVDIVTRVGAGRQRDHGSIPFDSK